LGSLETNTPPVANAGPNQAAYAWIDGYADVNLDGSGSYDDDNDVLYYYWSWTIDGNDYEANGVNPTIELPVGVHTIQLIVNDGLVDSVPDEVVVTVIEPVELWDLLAQDVTYLKLQHGIENSLLAKLDAAIQKLDDDNDNNDLAAINSLQAFINAVEAQSGKKISEEDVDDLIAAAQQIIDLLSSE
jgi:hypothetical protein